MAKRMLPKGPMKGKQKGTAIEVKGYTRKNGKRVKAYSRGKPGGKRG